jgi:hypothetical protein
MIRTYAFAIVFTATKLEPNLTSRRQDFADKGVAIVHTYLAIFFERNTLNIY